MHEPPLTLGMEEEYLLVNLETRASELDALRSVVDWLVEETARI